MRFVNQTITGIAAMGGRLYAGLAMFALIHLVMLVGVGLYAYLSGRIDVGKIEKIAGVLRDEQVDEEVEAGPSEEGTTLVLAGSAENSAKLIEETVAGEEMDQMRRERGFAELRNLSIMIDRRRLKLQKDQEAHQQQVARYEKQVKKREEQKLSSTHKKTIDTIGSLDSKRARDFLMKTGRVDAVNVLMALPDRKRQRILGACRSAKETAWRDQILEAMLKQPLATMN